MITSAPPSFILTDEDGILIGSSGGTSLLTGGTEGQAPIVQGDGSIAWGAAGASSLSELDDWAANTLTVPGALTVRQAGGVAGTDEIQIYHDGSNAYIDSQSGDLIFNNSNAKVDSSGNFTNSRGVTDTEVFGVGITNVAAVRSVIIGNNAMRSIDYSTWVDKVVIGYNAYCNSTAGTAIGSGAEAGYASVTIGKDAEAANQCVAIGYRALSTSAGGVAIGIQAVGGRNSNVVIGYQASAGAPTSSLDKCVVLGAQAVATATSQFIVGSDYAAIHDQYIGRGVVSATPEDFTLHATGGSGTDISGANLILAGGKPTGAGTPGQVQFQVAPSGASGTTLGTLTTVGLFDEQGLTVRQAGGVAGTDEIQIYHDGTDAYIDNQSGSLRITGDIITDDDSKIYLAKVWNTYIDNANQNIQFYSLGNLGLNVLGNTTRIPSNAKFCWSSSTANNTGEDTFLARNAATEIYTSGKFIVRQNGGVAGTDEVQIYHDGTYASIVSQSGSIHFTSSGASGARVTDAGVFSDSRGSASSEYFGVDSGGNSTGVRNAVFGRSAGIGLTTGMDNVCVGYATGTSMFSATGCVLIGSLTGNASGNHNTLIGTNAQGGNGGTGNVLLGYAAGNGTSGYSNTIGLGKWVKPTGSNQFVAGADSYAINDVYIGNGVANAIPADTTYHATGGSGTDISGANLILAGGKPTGAGTSGQVQFQVAPNGASGTTLGTLTTVGLFDEQGLTVRQAGGVAGTDEVQIYHDGSSGYIKNQSGPLVVGQETYVNGSIVIKNASGNNEYHAQQFHWFYDSGVNIWRMADGALTPAPGHTAWIGHLDATYGDGLQYVTWQELSSDPADPDEGRSCIWQSDGTGSGDDGDIMIKITAGGVTKTATLVDFSAV